MTTAKEDPWVSVQVTPEMRRYLNVAAVYADVTRSEYLRRLIEADMKKRPETVELSERKGDKRGK